MLEDLINQLQEIDDEQGVNIVKKFIEEHPSGAEPKEFVAFYNETCDRCGEFNENGLGNLTLLDAETNRSYKNALFAVKRKKIIERDKGAVFIPVCTKNVFLKMYSNKTGLQKMQRWDAIDAECYLNEIKPRTSNLFNSDGSYMHVLDNWLDRPTREQLTGFEE